MTVSTERIQVLNQQPVRAEAEYVLYWMTASRRIHYNFALQHAVDHCVALQKPLVILEALRCDYAWASDRMHAFVIQGMRDNRAAVAEIPNVTLLSFVEQYRGHGSGVLQQLAARACVIVTDDFPAFFLPQMIRKVALRQAVQFDAVDSNGLLPMQAADHDFPTAHAFRRHLQKHLAPYLLDLPEKCPLNRLRNLHLSPSHPSNGHFTDEQLLRPWQQTTDEQLQASLPFLRQLPIDHSVVLANFQGGCTAAAAQLDCFLNTRLEHYAESRNDPDESGGSGLSPYLHFGHISAHEILLRIIERESWTPDCLGDVKATRGGRSGWWGMSVEAEAFLDELVTWREVGFNFCHLRDDYDQYESLPAWARKTLADHADDPRPTLYSPEQLEHALTGDEIWNAAQTELVTTGRMHNYLRMLWGKKILEWSPSPQDALRVMIELNNKYAVDGRDPNSYSGIFWVLGRYDRAWGPERPIFGKIRYMSSDNTARKLKLKKYLARFAPEN